LKSDFGHCLGWTSCETCTYFLATVRIIPTIKCSGKEQLHLKERSVQDLCIWILGVQVRLYWAVVSVNRLYSWICSVLWLVFIFFSLGLGRVLGCTRNKSTWVKKKNKHPPHTWICCCMLVFLCVQKMAFVLTGVCTLLLQGTGFMDSWFLSHVLACFML